MSELTTNLDELEALEEEQAVAGLDEPYTPPNQLHIPQEAKDHFEQQGYNVHWVRIYVPNTQGELDKTNIQTKENDQYTFIPRDEIKGLKKSMTSYFGEEIDKGSHGLYIVGDLALAKIHKKRVEAKTAYNRNRTESRSRAVIEDLRRNSALPSSDRNEGWKIEQVSPKNGRDTRFG